MNVSTAISSGTEILQDAGIAESRREASSLLAYVLRKESAFLIAHPEFELKPEDAGKLEEYLNRRAAHEPFQYIVGRQEFYGLDFEVSPDVLIPRPETEILVEHAIETLSAFERSNFCEIGVGSGCISVSILHSVETAKGIGVDISKKALAVAQNNAQKHNVGQRLNLLQGDLFNKVSGTFDLIVSNPPYVPRYQIESLQREVRDFEPSTALDGGETGLTIIEKIIRTSPEFLKNGGNLLLEIGFDQASKVKSLFDNRIWQEPEFFHDLQGIQRIVKVMKKDGPF